MSLFKRALEPKIANFRLIQFPSLAKAAIVLTFTLPAPAFCDSFDSSAQAITSEKTVPSCLKDAVKSLKQALSENNIFVTGHQKHPTELTEDYFGILYADGTQVHAQIKQSSKEATEIKVSTSNLNSQSGHSLAQEILNHVHKPKNPAQDCPT